MPDKIAFIMLILKEKEIHIAFFFFFLVRGLIRDDNIIILENQLRLMHLNTKFDIYQFNLLG